MPDNTQDPTDPQVSSKLRRDWNDYVQYLADRGMKGNPVLDKNGVWADWIEKYRKDNPGTSISKETIPAIQQEFQKYRDWGLNEIKSGRMKFAPQTNESNYLKDLSQVDGIAGQRTTSFKFPETYLNTFDNGKTTVQKLGYSVADNK